MSILEEHLDIAAKLSQQLQYDSYLSFLAIVPIVAAVYPNKERRNMVFSAASIILSALVHINKDEDILVDLRFITSITAIAHFASSAECKQDYIKTGIAIASMLVTHVAEETWHILAAPLSVLVATYAIDRKQLTANVVTSITTCALTLASEHFDLQLSFVAVALGLEMGRAVQ